MIVFHCSFDAMDWRLSHHLISTLTTLTSCICACTWCETQSLNGPVPNYLKAFNIPCSAVLDRIHHLSGYKEDLYHVTSLYWHPVSEAWPSPDSSNSLVTVYLLSKLTSLLQHLDLHIVYVLFKKRIFPLFIVYYKRLKYSYFLT